MKQTPVMTENSKAQGNFNLAQSRRLKGYLNGAEEDNMTEAPPIADLFPHCEFSVLLTCMPFNKTILLTSCCCVLGTVMFGDIAGFTAWSSTRDPEQGN